MKADYQLDHGDIGIGSKREIQQLFDQSYFPPSRLLPSQWDYQTKREAIQPIIQNYGFPIICKPDYGLKGKAVIKVHTPQELRSAIPKLKGNYICQ